jgi:hypothetical protein
LKANIVDVKKLLLWINKEKQVGAELCLDLDCKIAAFDHRPLIKVLNHIIDYLRSLTDRPLQIGLSAHREYFVISFLAVSVTSPIPPIGPGVAEVIGQFGGTLESVSESGHFAKVLLKFQRL